MFSGKTKKLIRRLKRAKIARQQVEIFKPSVEVRYDEVNIVSHDSNAIQSTPVPASSNILLLGHEVDVIGIDEAQFFDDQLPYVCETLANNGTRVIVAGLDMDYLGKPLVLCLSCWPSPIIFRRYMQFVSLVVIWLHIRTGL